ncbi:4-chlorobenzoyl coenzyme A dehalogenase-2 [Colletotrichum chlorophyti]|uniref:4-chlorobenzoyl coenzyme A dehalogenase-2 n=1 Tax=Colletotrichum chlorophyti TaxID=708187 RepID=A0A1Q8RMW5_9PEZI|nr:4-chlorobenzoyl coenzyme A dehalogenase-2 [Colletotrichum chlorophyti]
MDSLTTLQLTVDAEKGVALVRFDRPAKRNAFSQAMISELVATLAHLDALDTVRAVVVTGGPDGPFCEGRDTNELTPPSDLDAGLRAGIS